MFLVFGDKHRTEPHPGGLCCVRNCPKCGAHTTFREHVISKQFRLYFVSMFTHDSHHVLACDACGTMFVTDEMKARRAENDHHGTVLGALQGLAKKTRAVAEDAMNGMNGGLGQAAQQTGKAVRDAVDAAQKRVGGLLERLRGKSDE